MMEQTRIYKALKGVRGRKPVDMEALERLMVRFSQLIAEQRWIKELDINPLIASPERLLALDARVVIYGPEVEESQLPPLAIRPYPMQYVTSWEAKDGSQVTIRPVSPEDEPMLVDFHETLSDRSVYMRYLHPMLLDVRIAHERLARICHGDYDREITLIAERCDPQSGENKIVGAGRISKFHGMNEARFSVLVSDCCQGLGIGGELMRRILQVSKQEKLRRIEMILTPDNHVMQRICTDLEFHLEPINDGQMVKAELMLA